MYSFLLHIALLSLPLSSASEGNCIDFFQARTIKHQHTVQTIDKVFVTQESIGLYYAKVKMAERTDLDLDEIIARSVRNLTQKKREKIQSYAEESLHEEAFPAVLSPEGKIFIIDGHHNLYMAVLASLNLGKAKVSLKIIRDYTGLSNDYFINDLIDNHLVYGSSQKKLLSHPKTIDSVGDSIERSLIGLAFLRIAKKYDIPFKGSHFRPFVQFDLANLIRTQKIFDLKEDYSDDNIKKLAKVILNNKFTLHLLMESLNDKAPQKIVDLLDEQEKQLLE